MATSIDNNRVRDLLTKKPFTRIMPDGHYSHGEIVGEPRDEHVPFDHLIRERRTQQDFLRELDPSGHLIFDKEYYPDIWRYDEETDRYYLQEVPRYAFAWQRIILTKQLAHFTGNDLQFELAGNTDDEESMDTLRAFKRGWAKKNMETSWYMLAKSVKSTGDGAIVGYIDNGQFGWKDLSFAKGDVLYPHYDRRTGRMNLFARAYNNYNEDGTVISRYIDVWDDVNYYRLRADGDEKNTLERIKSFVFQKVFNAPEYTVEETMRHGFPRIPVAYHRDDDGPCWTPSQDAIDNYEMAFSRLAQSNHDFGLPIMYIKGEGSEELEDKDFTHASKILLLPTGGEVGFLNRQDASNAYKSELDTLEASIYQQSSAVKAPELKSGDTPGVAIKMLYTDAYEKAMADAQEYQQAIGDLVDIFMYGYGMESTQRLDFQSLDMTYYVKPYIHLNETELITNLSASVQNGYLSKQTASEKSPYSTPQEWDRICKEQKYLQSQELLLQEQKLQIQSDIHIEEEEALADIEAAHADTTSTTVSDASASGNTGSKAKKTRSRKGSVATGHGRSSDGNYDRSGYDRWGNRQGPDGKVNKWDEWNRTH